MRFANWNHQIPLVIGARLDNGVVRCDWGIRTSSGIVPQYDVLGNLFNLGEVPPHFNSGDVLPFVIPADGMWRGRELEDGGERSGYTAFAVSPAT